MKQFYQNLHNYFKKDDSPFADRTHDIAVITITVKKFLNLMFEEIEQSGINNIEFLAKSELFLQSVTNYYSQEKFLQILDVLKSVDKRIEQSLFYHGLNVLRKIITGETNETLQIYNVGIIPFTPTNENKISEATFFTSFLIENIIKYCNGLRKLHTSKFMNAKDFRSAIDKKFDDLVFASINSLENVNLN